MANQDRHDADGKYSFCDVPGNYTVSEVVDPDYIATGPTSIDVELECDDSENNDFKNTALLCINGTKLDNCTGRGLADWTIELKNSTGSVIKTATTGPDGTYSFCKLVPGNYTVSEVVDPDYIATGPTSIDVELECADSENNDFKNTALLCINGTKLDNCTGRGLADWTIELKNSTGSVIKTATTGPDGTYSFCGLAPDTYTVCEVLQPGWVPRGDTCQPVVLSCTNMTGVDFYNDPLLCISGRKTHAVTGDGLSGWEINITDSSGQMINSNHHQ